MFCEPLSGKRTVEAHEHRTMTDWALQIKHLLDVDYPTAQKVILVCDHLNTHKPAALDKTFPPQEARRMSKPPGNRSYAQTGFLAQYSRN